MHSRATLMLLVAVLLAIQGTLTPNSRSIPNSSVTFSMFISVIAASLTLVRRYSVYILIKLPTLLAGARLLELPGRLVLWVPWEALTEWRPWENKPRSLMVLVVFSGSFSRSSSRLLGSMERPGDRWELWAGRSIKSGSRSGCESGLGTEETTSGGIVASGLVSGLAVVAIQMT